jgi:hypothetical protein
MERVQEGKHMKHGPMETLFDRGTCSGETRSFMVDSAISHCEKLRRILELEAWIGEARVQPLLARACERWQAEREQLLAELELSS